MHPQRLGVRVTCVLAFVVIVCTKLSSVLGSTWIGQRSKRVVIETSESFEGCGHQLAGDENVDFYGTIQRDIEEFPWIVRVYKPTAFCLGALISSTSVLLRDTCIMNSKAENLQVIVRVYNTSKMFDKESRANRYSVESIIFHNDPHISQVLNGKSNIALVRLRTKVNFSADIRPICVPPADLNLDEENVTVADWNIYNKAVLRNTKNVMKKRVTVWNRQQCQKYASNYSATEELCYGFDHNLNNNCHGGIVMYQNKSTGQWMVVGFTSWNDKCGTDDFVTAFTRISHLEPWIRSNDVPPNSLTPTAEHESFQECGHENTKYTTDLNTTDSRQVGEFPWMVFLHLSGRSFCWGVLFNTLTILTRASCISNYAPEEVTAFFGMYSFDYSHTTVDTQMRHVATITPHPDYLKEKSPNIAVVVLHTKVIFNAIVRPICLPPFDLNLDNKYAIAADIGDYEQSDEILRSTWLKKRLAISSSTECQKHDSSISTSKELCFGFDRSQNNDCHGQLMMYRNATTGQWFLVGILQRADKCGTEAFVSVFVRVSFFVNWTHSLNNRHLSIPFNNDFNIPLVASLSATLIVLLLLLLAIVINRHMLRIWLYNQRLCMSCITKTNEDDWNRPYDAFVSYSHKDVDFVSEELVRRLEGGDSGFRLCLHDRDWLAGEWIPDQIVRSVAASKRTIIVLSDHFVNSHWGMQEFHTAYQQLIVEKRMRLIIIMKSELSAEAKKKMDKKLRKYLALNTYLKWGDAWFWQRLMHIMPHNTNRLSNMKANHANVLATVSDHVHKPSLEPLPLSTVGKNATSIALFDMETSFTVPTSERYNAQTTK